MPCSCPFPDRIVTVFPEGMPLKHSRPLDFLILHCTVAGILLDALSSILSGQISVCLLLQAVGPLFLHCTAPSTLLDALHLNSDHSYVYLLLQAVGPLFLHCAAPSVLLDALHMNFDHSYVYLHLQAGDSLFMHYSGHGGSMPDDNGDEADGKGQLHALMFSVSKSCLFVSVCFALIFLCIMSLCLHSCR